MNAVEKLFDNVRAHGHADRPATTDVVIVGAGPTGLALGCVLAWRGVPFVLADRLAEGANTSRAAVIHPRTLEVLERLKVVDRLHAAGRVVPRFTIRDRDRTLATIPFDRLPSRYAYTLMVPQQVTEAILLDRLRELGGDVARPYVVDQIRQDDGGAVVTLTQGGGRTRAIRAKYVVGADGMHSTVREHAAIGFSGAAYGQSFVLADVHMQWPVDNDEVMLFFSPQGLVVVAPLPGDSYRVVATVDEAPEHPDVRDVQALLDSRGPSPGSACVRDVIWSSRFRVHHRLADRYRAGRLLLAGDAAHVHSPAGGQGMNTGIQDAVDLGERLATVLTLHGADKDLDDYERVRRPLARRVVAFTDRMTRIATLQTPGSRAVRNAVISIVGRYTSLPDQLAYELAGLGHR